MKAFNGYDTARVLTEGGERLPVGGYVLKIINVRFNAGANGNSDSITIAFDIAEGEQKEFFKKQFDANTNEDKKWKGTTTIWVPKGDGTEKDGWTANRFRTIVAAIEESNSGYTWDWDEKKWVGKMIGGVFQEVHTVIEGREITYTGLQPKGIVTVEAIRDGKFKVLEPLFKNGAGQAKPGATVDANGFISIPDGAAEELPF